MTDDISTYEVTCRTCRTKFKVQLFDSHEKNLFVVDKKDWYCDTCKKAYFKKQTSKLSKTHRESGFSELDGTEKMISWAETIRAELINKVNYLKQSLNFDSEAEKKVSDGAFEEFFRQWQAETAAKWWIDNRKMTVRDISKKIAEISQEIRNQ